MSMERDFIAGDTLPNSSKIVAKTASATLAAYEQVVQATPNEVADITITLPPVAEMAGKFVSVYSTANATYNVVVQDQDDSLGWSDMTLTTSADMVLLYSNGITWFKVVDVTT